MTRRTRKQRGLTPRAAALLLAACATIAWMSLRSHFGSVSPDGSGGDGDVAAEPTDVNETTTETVDVGRDLLVEFGSWNTTTPVRMAFASLGEAAVAAAPIGETDVNTARRWVGADPPTVSLGVLMVGEASRRAVVNGSVVGIGDKIDRLTIVAIERDAIAVNWGTRRITYGLDSEYPREFQNELQRRRAAQNGPAADGKKEEGQ